MTIELTEAQEKALGNPNGEFPRVIAPASHTEYVLIPIKEYQELAADVDEERMMRGIRRISMNNVARRALEES